MVDIVIGIDPGIKGSAAFIRPSGIEVVRLPVKVVKHTTRDMKFIDTAAWHHALVSRVPDPTQAICYLESVFSMSNDTPMTAFSFGNTKGRIEAALEIHDIKVVPVAPATWKGRMGVTADKATSRAKAERLYPGTSFKSVDDCEAALIATYGILFDPQ